MSADPITKFISVVDLHFPKPRFTSEDIEDAWITSMVKFLSPYSSVVLNRAAEHILQTRDGSKRETKYFPTPAEIIKVCDMFRRLETPESKVPLLSYGNRDKGEWSASRIELANELIQTETGREAARKGWIGALWDFARKFARLPQSHEVGDVKEIARGLDDDISRLERGEIDCDNAKELLNMARKVRARRAERAAVAGGSR